MVERVMDSISSKKEITDAKECGLTETINWKCKNININFIPSQNQ